jgi:hypothetical protein
MPRIAVHATVWAVVFAFWLVVTRGNQPTWTVAIIATLILVGASAVGVYADWYGLRPRFAVKGRWAWYVCGLLAVVAALTFVTVPLIQAVYDAAGIPPEVRFGFWQNVGLEAVWYAVHIGVAAGGRAVVNLFRRGRAADEHAK